MFAKKSLGQNFLKSQPALNAMVSSGGIQIGDVVLEIGPGKGALTKKLLEKGAIVHAVEKDNRLIELLHETFGREIADQRLYIYNEDALTFDPAQILTASGIYKIIANLPYYITGQFFRVFLTHTIQPKTIVVMVQKEVAERIVARDNKESILSISVKAYGTPKYVMTVQSKYFSPEPNVDSAIISVSNISREFFKDISEQKFFELLKAGFAHKRKVLIGNLSDLFPSEQLKKIFAELSIDVKIRAEDLTLEQWKQLAQQASKE